MFKFNTLNKMKKSNVKGQELIVQRGFTLIEILIVIGLIAVLAVIVLIAINPARQFAQARNTQRTSNVTTILNAIGQNIADNKGILTCASMGTIPVVSPMNPASGRNIGTPTSATIVDLGCLAPTYIASSIPMDPSGGTAADTKYTIQTDGVRYTVCAPNSVETAIVPAPAVICITR